MLFVKLFFPKNEFFFLQMNTAKDTNYIGTINPEALKLPVLQRKNKPSPYDTLATLSLKADNLRKDIVDAQSRLDQMLNVEKPTPFCTFKKWLVDFEDRIQSREKELNIFMKHLTNFRTDADPTFVEVDASDEKKPLFDPVSYSLLVSNQQRNFFSKEDIVNQNNELKILIFEQQDAIKKLRMRLKLFEDFQDQNAIKHTIQSLKEGSMPMALAGAAPTRATELRQKQKMLSKELTQLVRKRKELLKKYKAEKVELRRKRMLNEKATLIQKVFRGYMVRKYVKGINAAAVKIQKHVRGYLIRYHQRAEMEKIVFEEQRLSKSMSTTNGKNSSVDINQIQIEEKNAGEDNFGNQENEN